MQEWDGTTTNGDFKISTNIEVNSYLEIGSGKTLRLFSSGENAKITKKNECDNMFWVHSGGKLFIIGNKDNQLKIDGNCGNGTQATPTPIPTDTTYQGAAIYTTNGAPEIWLKYVTFYGFITHTNTRHGDNLGGIVTMGNHSHAGNTNGVCNMDHITFEYNYGGPNNTKSEKGFGRIISLVNGNWNVILDSVTIHDCIISEYLHGGHESIGGMGSAIRSQGNVGGSLIMRNCVAYNNTYRDLSGSQNHCILDYNSMDDIMAQPLSGQGGVINWRSGRKTADGDARVEILDCKFHHNSARCGGAVATCANIKMDKTKIYENEAEQGGGVYFYTYNGTDRLYDGNGFRAIFEGGVDIYDNSATKYGGGVYLTFDASDDVGFDADKNPMSPEFKLEIKAGSVIRNNKAPKGSGIALMDACPYSHYNNTNDHKKWSLEYQRTVTVNGGKVYENYAQDTEGEKMAGGGIYIEKYEYYEGHPLFGFHRDYTDGEDYPIASNSGTLNVNLLSGEIYGNSAVNDDIAGYGGGIYIASVFTADTIVSNLNVTIGHDSIAEPIEIYNNEAYTDGGGVYVRYDREYNRLNYGSVTVNAGTIGRLNPVTDANEGNKALTGNGGGICVVDGEVYVNGGYTEHNTAGQDGGGISVVGGKMYVNGGYTEHNTASQSGGGISVTDGYVEVASGTINHNTADQNGGGLYVNTLGYGSATWVYRGASISQNVAGQNGGGICMDNGELYIHSADSIYDPFEFGDYGELFDGFYGLSEAQNETEHTRITSNKALDGGGLYLENGYLHMGLTLLYDNEATNGNGGGGYIGEGELMINDCRILKNTAKVHGGGIGCREGYFDVYEGDISHNTASEGNGGGLYAESGGVYILNWDPNYITILSNNKAGGNGGGIYNEDGRIDITYANIANNEAGYGIGKNGNGGGIYCNNRYDDGQPNQRFIFADFLDNKAHGDSDDENAPLGCGGGIYMENGRYYSEYSAFFRNTAQTSGGAIYCRDGELRAYSALVGSDGNGNTATNGKGGGIITRQGNITIGPCDTYIEDGYDEISYIEHNTAKTDGGGICNLQGDITLIRSGINHNTAEEGKGGGVFINGGDLAMLGGQINNNTANHLTEGKGGGVYSSGGTFQIMSRQPNPIVNFFAFETMYKTDQYGDYELDEYGNYIIVGYNFVYKITHQGLPVNPSHTFHKGVFYTTDPNWAYATYISNDLNNIVEGRVTNHFNPDTFEPNTTYYFKACAWYEDDEENEYYYAESPVFEYDFSDSKATGKGIRKHRSPNYGTSIPGDKAMGKANRRPRSIYPAVEENPFFMELTPLQQAIMAHTLEADSTTFRKRKNRPVRDSEPNDTLPEINNNTATYGGGVYVDEEDAELIFSGGEIKANYASEDGGGVYITQNASMQMKRHCQVVENHVPAGKDGGGIYLDGTLLVGENQEDAPTVHSLKVEKNWAGDGPYSEAERNNVFLPLAPILSGDALHKKRVITLLSDISGKTNDIFNTKIGISVDRGFREVIYSENDEHEGGATSSKQWLEKLMPESGNVLNSSLFDDAQTYYALHVVPTDDLFDEDYIYFWSCWTTIVNTDPNNDGTGTTHYTTNGESGANEVWHIYTREGLAWFSSLINGLNGVTANPAAKAFVENDLDMSAHLWVPLGSVSKAEGTGTDIIFTDGGQYSGEFDGQGNIISGLICTYMTGILKYGLFGTLSDGAKVNNTFVDDYKYLTYKQKKPDGNYNDHPAYKLGGIAAEIDNSTAVISNCEARGQLRAVICDAENTYVGGIAGDVKQGAIHSCMAMPTINGTAKHMGGLAGNLATATTLKNSYANVLFSSTPTPTYNVGGIAGVNNGTIENVYVRYNNATNTPDLANDKFYWIAGLNTGSISYCFSPKDNTGSGKWDYTEPNSTAATKRRTYEPTFLVSDKYGFAHDDQKAEAFDNNTDGTDFIPMENGNPLSRMTYDATTHETNFNGLVGALNKWVAGNSTSDLIYTPWTRTMASTINDDYPVLEIDDFNVVGTEDGVYMKYDYNVNDMWSEDGKNFKALTVADNPKAAMYLYKTNPTAISVTENTAVPLHIHQNVGVLQEEGKNLTVRVGVTFDNSDGTIANGGAPYDWHMFSSALKAAPLGITYQSSVTEDALGGKVYEIYNNRTYLSHNGITHTNYGNRDYMDPPVIKWNTEEGTVGYFPTNTPYGKWGGNGHWPSQGPFSGNSLDDYNSFDFYCLDEPSRHWINFKREGSANFMDHWHQDIDASGNHKNLKYMNEGTLRVGKGYMMGVSKTSMLMADGILNNGTFESEQAVTSTPYNFNMSGYSEELRGFNLVGNPYHSYLDFHALLAANLDNIIGDAYYLFDADAGRYICYPDDASDNRINAPRFLHPHQGFLVKTDKESCMLTFNNDMRSATANPVSYFREERLNYPLVNLFCHDAAGFYDVTTVEMNRPQLGGGVKLKETRNGNSLIYARLENEDYQTLFAPTGTSTVPVRFEPSQNGVYTLRWDTMHGDFSHLHLIDNLTGADIDLLNQTEYRFEGKVGDYVSRFKLVFEVTDIEEHEQESETNFAFQFGDELVVNGGGELSVFDVQGRHIMTRSLTGAQSSISLPRTAAGLYILRLAGDKQVKIQKLIIK